MENNMQVNSNCSMQQTQMRKMDGSGGGQGGMRDIMQSLSTEDRAALKEQMSSLSQSDRMAAVTQMKEVDATALSSEDYTKALLDILNKATAEKTQSDSFSVYA
jgi:peptidyl-tRNA hydrolase